MFPHSRIISALFVPVLATGGANAQRLRDKLAIDTYQLRVNVIDTTIFIIAGILAIVTLVQCVIHLLLFRPTKQRPEEDFPRRIPYTSAMFFSTVMLTAYWSIYAVDFLESRNQAGYNWHLGPVFHALVDLCARFADIGIYVAVLILFRDRRTAYLQESGSSSSSRKWLFYTTAPISFLGILIASTIVRFGIKASDPDNLSDTYFDVLNALRAMAHVYIAFELVLMINIVAIFIILYSQISRNPSSSHATYDCTVFGRLFKFVLPGLVFKAIYGFVAHIITYDSNILISIDATAFVLVSVIIVGLNYIWIFAFTARLGRLPKVGTNVILEEKASV